MPQVPPPLPPSAYSQPAAAPLPPLPVLPALPPVPVYRGPVVIVATVALVFLVLVGSLGLVGWRAYQSRQPAPFVAEDRSAVYREASAAFGRPTAPRGGATTPEAVAAQNALNQLSAALRRNDLAAVTDLVDVERLVLEVERSGVPLNMTRQQRAAFITRTRGRMGGILQSRGDLMTWRRHDVRLVKPLAGGELLVYHRGWSDGDYPTKLRWWLRRDGNRWRIYDFEDMDMGNRLSTLIGYEVTADASPSTPAWVGLPHQISDAYTAMEEEDLPKAEQILDSLDTATHPPTLEGSKIYARGVFRKKQERYEEALGQFQKAADTFPALAAAHYQRASALTWLERYDDALVAARQYEAQVGADGESRFAAGVALSMLDREAEALAAYREGAKIDPDCGLCLRGIAAVTGAEGLEELRSQLRAAASATETFRQAARQCAAYYDGAALQVISDAYASVLPPGAGDDPWHLYYSAEAAWLQERHADATALARRALPLAPQGQFELFHEQYLKVFDAADQPLEGYAGSPDRDAAFRHFGESLSDRDESGERLHALVEAHRRVRPGDPLLEYYRGFAYGMDDKDDAAFEAFTRGLRAVQEPELQEQYQNVRAQAAFLAGKALAAYDGTVPRVTFDRLTERFAGKDDADGLEKLIALHARTMPSDPDLPLWRAEVAYIRGDYASALDALDDAYRPNDNPPEGTRESWRWQDRAVRANVRLKRFDEALAYARDSDGETTPWYATIIHAAAGRVAEATKLLDGMLENDDELTPGDFYEDEDLGPLLRTGAFSAWRAAHPEPTTQSDQPTSK